MSYHAPQDQALSAQLLSMLADIKAFLGVSTPTLWLQTAVNNLEALLVDHAQCEKKAASAAMQLMFRYPQDAELCRRMSKLAREELRHFEQVAAHMQARQIVDRQQTASRYASSLKTHIRKDEPHRLIDALLVGAFIEARSCERFAALVPWLVDTGRPADLELADFYRGLLASEGRHFKHYIELAEARAGYSLEARLAELRAVENTLVIAPDETFRFHSGPPLLLAG
ncbi:tRNA-(ms[2]io[6]A)-hydroxylase [Allohahella sp. A8]|uniref:tRNA-(ms[2]io[6]A)-hydroxylase n=1 Tax=Allohahella sp. A8 TaxID=3141461 RepID=UPI003A8013D0